MKKTVLVLVLGILLVAGNLYAKDLIVNGKVGIGTNSPSNMLNIVVPSSRNAGGINITNEAGANTGVRIDLSGTSTRRGASIRIDSNGPNTVQQRTFSDTLGPSFLGVRGRGSVAAKSDVLNGDALYKFSAQGWGEGESHTGGKLAFEATEDWTWRRHGTRFSFYTTPNGSSIDQGDQSIERLRIDHNGNVGIGITNPQSRLAVSGLSTTKPDTSATKGVLCITENGNIWIETDGDCFN